MNRLMTDVFHGAGWSYYVMLHHQFLCGSSSCLMFYLIWRFFYLCQ